MSAVQRLVGNLLAIQTRGLTATKKSYTRLPLKKSQVAPENSPKIRFIHIDFARFTIAGKFWRNKNDSRFAAVKCDGYGRFVRRGLLTLRGRDRFLRGMRKCV